MLNNVENLNPLICLLYGYCGNGRKTCIQHCVNQLQQQAKTLEGTDEIKIFYINGSIQTTELQII